MNMFTYNLNLLILAQDTIINDGKPAMGGVRKIDSESGSDSETKTPNLAPYPVSLQILDSGSGPYPSLMLLVHPIYTSA